MNFLKNLPGLNGFYVITLDKHIFAEFQDEGADWIYVFPFKYHAQFYLDSFTDRENPFTISFYSIEKLYFYNPLFNDVVIASCGPDGNPVFEDYLFPTEDSILH